MSSLRNPETVAAFTPRRERARDGAAAELFFLPQVLKMDLKILLGSLEATSTFVGVRQTCWEHMLKRPQFRPTQETEESQRSGR